MSWDIWKFCQEAEAVWSNLNFSGGVAAVSSHRLYQNNN